MHCEIFCAKICYIILYLLFRARMLRIAMPSLLIETFVIVRWSSLSWSFSMMWCLSDIYKAFHAFLWHFHDISSSYVNKYKVTFAFIHLVGCPKFRQSISKCFLLYLDSSHSMWLLRTWTIVCHFSFVCFLYISFFCFTLRVTNTFRFIVFTNQRKSWNIKRRKNPT